MNPKTHIPLLLYHDPTQHILILEDLENLPTLDKWLAQTPESSMDTITSVATDLGTFLADFHTSTVPDNRESLSEIFSNEDMREVVFAAAVEPILDILNRYKVEDAQTVYDIVVNDFQEGRKDSKRLVLNLGDLWTGSILVEKDGSEVGVIDWEFANLGPASQDIGQLCMPLI